MPRSTVTVPRRHTVAPHGLPGPLHRRPGRRPSGRDRWCARGAAVSAARGPEGGTARSARAPAHARRRAPRAARARARGAGPHGGARRLAGLGRPDAARRAARIRHRAPVVAPGRGRRGGPRRAPRRRQHWHRLGEEPRLPHADPQRPHRGRSRRQRSRGDRALPVPDQGAGGRPAEPRRRPLAARRAARHLRRRHPDRRASLDPRPRQPRAHQPRPRPPLAPAAPRPLELVPAGSAVRRHRRVPRLQGGLRRPHRRRPASPASRGGALQGLPHLRLRLGHRGRARGPRGSPPRYAGRRGHMRRVAACAHDVRALGATTRAGRLRRAAPGQHHHRDGRPARRLRARAGADRGLRPVPRRGRGRRVGREGEGAGDRGSRHRGIPRRLPARGAARARASPARQGAARPRCDQRPRARRRRQRTRRCAAGRLAGHAVLALAAGGAGRPVRRALARRPRRRRRPPRHLPRAPPRRRSSAGGSRPRSSTPTTRTCSRRTSPPLRRSCR